MDKLVNKIETAFAGIKCPPLNQVITSETDRIWIDWLTDEISGDWKNIPKDCIEHEHYALSSVQPLAFKYLLPAFMIWVLENYKTSSSNTVDYTIYSLDLQTTDKKSKHLRLQQFAVLNNEQIDAVVAFLNFIATKAEQSKIDTHAASQALSAYWDKKYDE